MAEKNYIEEWPWGKFEIISDEPRYKIKLLTVYPGGKLSLQSHKRRAEHWIVISGTARAINGENEITLNKNENTFIPAGNKHRLENPEKKGNLEIIEVQTGDYFGEDDIVRYKDVYGRA